MKWKYYSLPDNDPKAKKRIFDTLSTGTHARRALSKKLIDRFSVAAGPVFAIALESLDLDKLVDYEYATFAGGKRWYEAAGTNVIPVGDRPNDGLIQFVDGYLRGNRDAKVLSESWWTSRKELSEGRYKPHLICYRDGNELSERHFEPHLVYYRDDVYQLLTPSDTDLDFIEETICEAESRRWMTAVCSRMNTILESEIPLEATLDEIVANTAHIFVSAFDNEGYLVWSPVLAEAES